ncbi:response regulator transcription factor [Saccharopolyspora sp. NPDC050642]|uniref:response regulator transcription factor n=1 Tax=Saccharopolyspora sp. NPDC050642 TaxID=3157099 RepID=UPI0033C1E796
MLVRVLSDVTVFADRPELQEKISRLLDQAPERLSSASDVAVLAYGGTLPADALVHCVSRLSRSYRVLVVLPEQAAAQVPELLRAGALGFIGDGCDDQEFYDALGVVARGAVYVASGSRAALIGGGAPAEPAQQVLTRREQEVLRWIADGYTHSQAARRMGLSGATVDTYVKRIRAKLEVRNKAELTRKAIELGVVRREPLLAAA